MQTTSPPFATQEEKNQMFSDQKPRVSVSILMLFLSCVIRSVPVFVGVAGCGLRYAACRFDRQTMQAMDMATTDLIDTPSARPKVILVIGFVFYLQGLRSLFNWRQSALMTRPESRDSLEEAYLHVPRQRRGDTGGRES